MLFWVKSLSHFEKRKKRKRKKGEWTEKVEMKTRIKFPAVAIFWSAPGFKGIKFVSSGFSKKKNGTSVSASSVPHCCWGQERNDERNDHTPCLTRGCVKAPWGRQLWSLLPTDTALLQIIGSARESLVHYCTLLFYHETQYNHNAYFRLLCLPSLVCLAREKPTANFSVELILKTSYLNVHFTTVHLGCCCLLFVTDV